MGHRLVVNKQLTPESREATPVSTRAMQKKLGLLADSYTTMELLARMRGGW